MSEIVLTSDYRPLPKAIQFHTSSARFKVLVGGYGCISEGARVLTDRGYERIGDIIGSRRYGSYDNGLLKFAQGTQPFVKGKGDLYRVVHERGEFVAFERHLVFSGDREYRRLVEMRPGDSLYWDCEASLLSEVFSSPRGSSLESSQQEYVLGVERSIQKLLSLMDDYLVCSRQCDQQLLSSLGGAQARPPLQACAGESYLGSDPFSFLREGVRAALAQVRSHLDQSPPHRSMQDYHSRSLVLADDVAAFLCVVFSERILQNSLQSKLSREMCEFRLRAQKSFYDHTYGHQASEATLPESSIKAIEKVGTDWYWDLQVLGTNNYWSEGCFHHNSGKSKMAIEEVSTLMAEHPGIEIFVMRKTMPALRDSTLNEFLKHIPYELGQYNGKTDTYRCHNGSKMMFRGLDEPTKLKSTNVAVVVFDEAEEFTLEDFRVMNARIRQKRPDGTFYPLYFIMITNPVDEQHWIYKEFVTNRSLYEAPEMGGLLLIQLSTYDNLENLPPNYIEQITVGMTPQEIERYIAGQWGTIVRGKGVYTDVFNSELHLRKWTYDTSMLILRGWDFGFNHPACVWRLKDLSGRKNIDFELIGDKENIQPFARRVLALTEQRYGKNLKVYDFCDPRGFDKKDTGQSSVDALNELGVYPVGERGTRSYVEPGIQVVRKELSTLISGVPELTINPECVIMKAGFGGRYVRDDEGNPKKDGYYEHPMDADRYTAFNDKSNTAVRDAMLARQRKVSTIQRNKYTGY